MADTGWIIAAQGVNDTGKGSAAWSNPDRVTADDGSNATASPSSSSESNWLRSAHDFQNMLPIDAVINGIECRAQVSGPAATLDRIIEIQLHDGSTFIGTAKTPNTTIPDSATDLDFGGALDLWGAVLNLITIGFCGGLPIQFGFRVDTDNAFPQIIACDATWMKIHYGILPGNRFSDIDKGPDIPGGRPATN